MAYQVWSVVFGEQPSASKWNILGTNDAGFNDGTAIGDNAIINRHLADDIVKQYDNILYSGAILRKSANQSIANGTITTVLFDTETKDTDAYHSTVSNTGRITIPKTGVYLVEYMVTFAANTTGQRYAWIALNGSTSNRFDGYMLISASSSDSTAVGGTAIMSLAATDYVETMVFQNSGGALNVSGGATAGACRFAITRLGS